MKKNIGVWIDHREAVVVELSEAGKKTSRIESAIESQPRRASDNPSGSFESLQVPSDSKLERKKQADLGHFFDDVVSHLAGAEALFVFGPGEAKRELAEHIDGIRSLSAVPRSSETSDSMSEAQVIAKVVEHFSAK